MLLFCDTVCVHGLTSPRWFWSYRLTLTTYSLEIGDDMNRSWSTRFALAFLVLLTASCGSFEPGKPIAMDDGETSDKLQRIAFTVPDGFEFAQGVTYAEFVGTPAWTVRFDAPKELGDGPTITAANPSYPPVQPMTCNAVPPGNWTSVGFTCEPEMLSTVRPHGGGPDAVSVMFTRGARESSLFIHYAGH